MTTFPRRGLSAGRYVQVNSCPRVIVKLQHSQTTASIACCEIIYFLGYFRMWHAFFACYTSIRVRSCWPDQTLHWFKASKTCDRQIWSPFMDVFWNSRMLKWLAGECRKTSINSNSLLLPAFMTVQLAEKDSRGKGLSRPSISQFYSPSICLSTILNFIKLADQTILRL